MEDAPGGSYDQFKLLRTRQVDSFRDRLYELIRSAVEVEAHKGVWEQAHMLPIDERNDLAVPEEVFQSDIRVGIKASLGRKIDSRLDPSG